jgi:hypothetical protein
MQDPSYRAKRTEATRLPEEQLYRANYRQAKDDQREAVAAAKEEHNRRFALIRDARLFVIDKKTGKSSPARARNVRLMLEKIHAHSPKGKRHTLESLIKATLFSERTVREAIKDAIDLGVLKRRRLWRYGTRGRYPNEYDIDWEWLRIRYVLPENGDKPPGSTGKVCQQTGKAPGSPGKVCLKTHLMSARAQLPLPFALPDAHEHSTSPTGSPAKPAATADTNPTDGWEEVVAELVACGVRLVQRAADAARSHGVSASQAMAIVGHYKAHRGAWRDAGALYDAMINTVPGAPPDRFFPPMEKGYQQRQRKQREDALSTKAGKILATADDRRAPRWVYVLAAVLIDQGRLEATDVAAVCREARDAGCGFESNLQALCNAKGAPFWTPETGLREQAAVLGETWDPKWEVAINDT